MSYDLESLKLKEGLSVASLVFATGTDMAGTAFIASVLNGQAIIHQIFLQASAFATVQLGQVTAAASGNWIGFGNQTAIVEPVRIPVPTATGVYLSGANGVGNGVIRVWYTKESVPAGAAGGGLNL